MRALSLGEVDRMAEAAQAAFLDVRANTDATLYSRYVDGRDYKYQRYEILDVEWRDAKAVATNGTEADKAVLVIPFTRSDGSWTPAVGDVIVFGIVEDEIEDDDDPSGSRFTVSDLERKYSTVMTISSVETVESIPLSYWKVGAK